MANTGRYADMVKEDRDLRLAGYEVYRFGGKELTYGEQSRQLLRALFASLMTKHTTQTS
jgi:hypothetical protein